MKPWPVASSEQSRVVSDTVHVTVVQVIELPSPIDPKGTLVHTSATARMMPDHVSASHPALPICVAARARERLAR